MDNQQDTFPKSDTVGESKENFLKSRSLIKKKYNEKVFFDRNKEKNKNGRYTVDKGSKQRITKIINELIDSDNLDIGETYIPNKAKNIDNILKNSKFKVNLNISNNYYNYNNEPQPRPVESENNYQNKVTDRSPKRENPIINTDNAKCERPKRVFIGSNESKKTNEEDSYKNKLMTSPVQKNRKNDNIQNDQNAFYLPCINCNTLIYVDEIDAHSLICTTVKKEVYEVDSVPHNIKAINYKLWKLEESLIKIKSKKDFDNSKDNYYILSLLQYISDSLSKISNLIIDTGFNVDEKTIDILKKTILNVDSLIVRFKGTFSTQILLERAKYLFKEKIKISKEEVKKNTSMTSRSKSSKCCTNYIEELEKVKKEKEQTVDKLNLEKEKIKGKVYSARNSAASLINPLVKVNESIRNGTNKKPVVFLEESDEDEEEDEEYLKIDKQPNVLDDINSEVDNLSQHSWNSDLSDIASTTKSVTPLDVELRQSSFVQERKSGFLPQRNSVNKDANIKKMYKNFVKIFLKIKFEKIDMFHPGQKIPEKVLFKECLKDEVPEDKFQEYILKEINKFDKYSAYVKRNNKKHQRIPKQTRMTKYVTKPLMDIISEESI